MLEGTTGHLSFSRHPELDSGSILLSFLSLDGRGQVRVSLGVGKGYWIPDQVRNNKNT
jgi:hypothetical protein